MISSTEPATTAAPRPRREMPPLMALSPAAASRLRRLYEAGEGRLLRLSVNTKGCSGLAYDMSWVEAPGPGDEVVRDGELTVLVDRKASLFLIGTTMDYQETALSTGFTFTNPNEKGRCGCGESFHV